MVIRRADRLVFAVLLAIGVMMIVFGSRVSAAVAEAVDSCLYRIIPSLFGMTVISTAISKSGLLSAFVSKFGINAEVFTAFVFGNIGGYPIGAKLLKEAVTDGLISKEAAEKAMTFCFGSGPAFAAGVAGSAIFGDYRFGLAALFACIASNLTLYAIFIVREGKVTPLGKAAPNGFSTALMMHSVDSALHAMAGICSMILFFSALRGVLESIFPSLTKAPLFAPLLEISNISVLNGCKVVSLVTVALLLAFGGVCVNMQLFSIINGAFTLKRFYLSRLISFPLTAAYAYLTSLLMPKLGIVIETATKIRLSRSRSLIPIICVAAMVLITMLERSKIKN